MTAGPWLDLLLAALLLGAVTFLFRGAWSGVAGSGRPESAAPAAPAGPPGARGSRPAAGGGRSLTETYRPLLRQAGFDSARSVDYWSFKLLAAVLLPLALLETRASAGTEVGSSSLLMVAVATFLLPDLVLLALRRSRRQKVSRALPYFLDLVIAFLHSGLSLVEAFRRSGREAFPGPHPLAREVRLIGLELDAGQDPLVAFGDLAERTGVKEIKAVTASLRMGMRLGAPVETTLRSQAELLWLKRREEALRRIHRAQILMLLPVVLTSFPIFAVLAFYPVLTEFLNAFNQMTGLRELFQ